MGILLVEWPRGGAQRLGSKAEVPMRGETSRGREADYSWRHGGRVRGRSQKAGGFSREEARQDKDRQGP